MATLWSLLFASLALALDMVGASVPGSLAEVRLQH